MLYFRFEHRFNSAVIFLVQYVMCYKFPFLIVIGTGGKDLTKAEPIFGKSSVYYFNYMFTLHRCFQSSLLIAILFCLSRSARISFTCISSTSITGKSLSTQGGVAIVEVHDGVAAALDGGDLRCLWALARGTVR